jgi:hypothetical protein
MGKGEEMEKKDVAGAVVNVLHALMERYPSDRDMSDRVKKYEPMMRGEGDLVKVLAILAEELREADRRRAIKG